MVKNDINKLEDCENQLTEILETYKDFSLLDLPMDIHTARYHIRRAVKWMKFLTGEIKVDDLSNPGVWTGDLHNLCDKKIRKDL